MRINEIITEGNAKASRAVAVYGGRFQPMHRGHYMLYRQLVQTFGVKNVFIATMFGKQQQVAHAAGNFSKDPFTFDEKKMIATRMFELPENAIFETSPYRPDLDAMGVDTRNTALVLAYSDKDENRITGTTISKWQGLGSAQPVSTGQIYTVEMTANFDEMSATDFRNTMSDQATDVDEKKKVFNKFFGKFDQEIFDFIHERMTQ